jgi:transposase
MPPIEDSKTLAAAGAETEECRRPTIVSAPAAASPELLARPVRRTFTAKDKLRVLGEVDRAAGTPGAISAIIRREGILFVSPDGLAPPARRGRLPWAEP